MLVKATKCLFCSIELWNPDDWIYFLFVSIMPLSNLFITYKIIISIQYFLRSFSLDIQVINTGNRQHFSSFISNISPTKEPSRFANSRQWEHSCLTKNLFKSFKKIFLCNIRSSKHKLFSSFQSRCLLYYKYFLLVKLNNSKLLETPYLLQIVLFLITSPTNIKDYPKENHHEKKIRD